MQKLVDVSVKHIWDVLSVLLEDKTTGKNVVWATDEYASRGPGYGPEDPITKSAFTGDDPVLIQPRIEKDAQEQQARTKKKAEVYTPSWLCNKMNNYCDAEWFGRPDVFNKESGGAWTAREEPVWFNEKKGRKIKEWQKYVDSRRLEITCGEAPFLVSRYDAATGESLPIKQRIGILDRKLRVVDENTTSETDWLKWAQRAVQSCYGYEFQGDSLLIARINVLMTFCEYYKSRWEKEPVKRILKTVANIVAWNIWQMDGINDATPLTRIARKRPSFPLIEEYDPEFLIDEPSEEIVGTLSKIKNWRSKYSFEYKKLKETGFMKKKMFDFIIGNPPYQDEMEGTSDTPVYNYFMDAAYGIGEKVELITPARFLFNAGKTPKAWNKKMLEDEHLQVLFYDGRPNGVFSGNEIKGGVAITYRDKTRNTGAIEHFIPDEVLRNILYKVRAHHTFTTLSKIINATEHFKLNGKMYEDHPEFLTMMVKVGNKEVPLVSRGHESDLTSNILDKNARMFSEEKPSDGNEYIRVYGRQGGRRIALYFRADYMQPNEGLHKYKVVVPESNNDGTFGETLVGPFVADKDIATTQTFITMGFCDTKYEADALLKYICGKFARAMLGTLKITQHNKREAWRNVPMQDFTVNSDIDWSLPINEIDRQLYKKYRLSDEEITFIETHVKEMN